MEVKDCLKIGATGLAGMFTGSAMYINLVDHPARMTTLDTVNNRKTWSAAFHRAKVLQGGMCMLGSLAGATVYYLDKDSSDRNLWLVGSGVFILCWPFFMVAMRSDIEKNLKDDVFETAGESWVRNHIVRWNKQHGVRTVLGFSAFSIFLFALSRK